MMIKESKSHKKAENLFSVPSESGRDGTMLPPKNTTHMHGEPYKAIHFSFFLIKVLLSSQRTIIATRT